MFVDPIISKTGTNDTADSAYRFCSIILYCFLFFSQLFSSALASVNQSTSRYAVSSSYQPVITNGEGLSQLNGIQVVRIAAYASDGSVLTPIPFQIDRRDEAGVFILRQSGGEKDHTATFDSNDECVFMFSDLGRRVSQLPKVLDGVSILSVSEIEVHSIQDNQTKWVYIVAFQLDAPKYSSQKYVYYDPQKDQIHSGSYLIGFSDQRPFLMDTLKWQDVGVKGWSQNLIDGMRITHTGKLFGWSDFVRTEWDYTSRLIAYKAGSVRIIRRTSNQVRVLGFLRTPSINVDYIAHAHGFSMDTMVDFPFKIGWFFDDVDTQMSVAWKSANSLPVSIVYSNSSPGGVKLRYGDNASDSEFNRSGDKEFVVSNVYGKMLVSLAMEEDFEVKDRIYLVDEESDGNVSTNLGFYTTNWESVDTDLHHLLFNVSLIRDITLADSFRMLRGY